MMTTDEKWPVVKEYYEGAYRVTFRKRPDDPTVEMLYGEMEKLAKSVEEIFEAGRPTILRLVTPSRGPLREQ